MSSCQGAKNYQVYCRGAVQGRGIRPLVASLASKLDLYGCVYNDLGGVRILLHVAESMLERFLFELGERVTGIVDVEVNPIKDAGLGSDFFQAVAEKRLLIVPSQQNAYSFHLPRDIGICGRCEPELHGGNVRRSNYLLNACSQCGPRYTVLKGMPFDRENTSLTDFEFCDACAAEYKNVDERRCYSQLINCNQCGPRYWLEDAKGNIVSRNSEGIVVQLSETLLNGGIVAIKSIGGFHLCCDASNDVAVERIRKIKNRPHKALAIMGELNLLKAFCQLQEEDINILKSDARPIALVSRIFSSDKEVELKAIAPGLHELGVMLPSTALQLLLVKTVAKPLVMTSANLSGQPIIIDNDEIKALQNHVDLVAFNNRDIINPIDDAVVSIEDGMPQVIRLGKGLAPYVENRHASLRELPSVVAMGAELKSSYGFARGDELLLSPYQGDLYHAEVYSRFQKQLKKDISLFNLHPNIIAIDSHPDYHSSQLGRSLAEKYGADIELIQHHHAHAIACIVEHNLTLHKPTLAIVMDGYGWGDDGSLWGGELLAVTGEGYQRIASIKPFPVVGGHLTATQPWRNSLSLLRNIPKEKQHCLTGKMIGREDKQVLLNGVKRLLEKEHDQLVTSSVGRLFDGIAALLGFPEFEMTYEGQAAIWLQHKAESYIADRIHDESKNISGLVALTPGSSDNVLQIDPTRFIDSLLEEECIEAAAYHFHCWLADSFTKCVEKNVTTHSDGVKNANVVLAGGVMQNRLLVKLLEQRLSHLGFNVYWPQQVPANDGGIALGQLAIAAARSKGSELKCV